MSEQEKKGILKVWSFLGSLVVVIGIFKYYIYYQAFKVNITEYLDLGEALLLFSIDLLPTAIVIGSVIFFALSTQTESEQIKARKLLSQIADTKNFLRRVVMYSIVWWHLSLMVLISGTTYVIVLFSSSDERIYDIGTIFWAVLLGLAWFIIIEEIKIINEKFNFGKLTKRDQGWFMLLVLVFIVTYMEARHEVFKKKYEADSTQYTFTYKDGTTVKSNNDTIYLGKTKGYLFFYLKSKDESIVYKTDEVRLVSIRATEHK